MVQGRTRPGHLLPGWLWTTATLAGALILCAPVSGQAAVEAAVVEGMQMPVWLIRDGRRSALRPQASLVPGDKIITGQRARLRLRMAEGSLVKLGENADFKIADFEPSTTRGGAFEAFWMSSRARFDTPLQCCRVDIDVTCVFASPGLPPEFEAQTSGEKPDQTGTSSVSSKDASMCSEVKKHPLK